MDRYVTGDTIRALRERKRMTQEELAEQLFVSAKAVSKWETGKGYPDISLLEPLGKALGVSILELLSGQPVQNRNRCANMARGRWYVCPLCQNVVWATGEAVVCCCGITLPPLEPEAPDKDHGIRVSRVEDEYLVTVDHPMTKGHYLSFLAAVSDGSVQLKKLHSEGEALARFRIEDTRRVYACCNRDGLFAVRL